MSCVYMTSDWHLGHKKAFTFSGTFPSQEEREGTIIENYMSNITKRDIVWFLGDIAFTLEDLTVIKKLPGDKRLLLGNHDLDKCGKTDKVPIEQIVLTFDQVFGMCKYKYAWLTHSPIHPDELRGSINIHGHVHDNTLSDNRYFNACLENTDFKPIKYQEILQIMKQRRADECKTGCKGEGK